MGNGHSILFFFFGWATIQAADWPQIWQGLMGPTGPGGGGSGPREKNPISKWARFGPRAKIYRSGPGMEKPGLNPTRCHSYLEEFHDLVLQKLLSSLVIKGADDLNIQGWSWSHKQESLCFLSQVWALVLQRPNREGVCELGACMQSCQ